MCGMPHPTVTTRCLCWASKPSAAPLADHQRCAPKLLIMDISITLVQLIWVLAKCFGRETLQWSVSGRLTPTQPMVMQSEAIRARGGPGGLICTYTLLFLWELGWIQSAVSIHTVCVCVHSSLKFPPQQIVWIATDVMLWAAGSNLTMQGGKWAGVRVFWCLQWQCWV